MTQEQKTQEQKEKEAYRQAFASVRIPHPIDPGEIVRERKTTKMKWYHKYAAALSAAMILLGSAGVAYAADLGGLRTTVTVWLNGKAREMEAEATPDGYRFSDPADGDTAVVSGGVAIGEDGSMRRATLDEAAEALSMEVWTDEAGRTWLGDREKKWDITDFFDDQGLAHGSYEGRYYDIERHPDDDGFSISASDRPAQGTAYRALGIPN